MINKRRALGRGLAALIPAAAGPPSPTGNQDSSPHSSDPPSSSSGVSARAPSAASSSGSSAPFPAGSGAPSARPSTPGSAPGATLSGTRTTGGAQPRGTEGREGLRVVGIEEVHPARDQPRKAFDDARLDELASSIRSQGLIQPLVVRVREAGGYEIIAGERRWRAAQRAGLHTVPVVVREIAHARAFELAMVENLQREDLNPIEEAEGFDRLIKEFGYSQESLAVRVGKDRTTVTNALRLLKLPPGVRALVISGRLSMGHARAILGLEVRHEPRGPQSPAAPEGSATGADGHAQADLAEQMERLGRRVAAKEMSVRQVEALVRSEKAAERAAPTPAPDAAPSTASARDLTTRLSRALGTRVRVVERGPGTGHLEIHYGSLDQLDSFLARLMP